MECLFSLSYQVASYILFHLSKNYNDIAEFDSVGKKERHMKIHHSDGQYVQCPKCVEPIPKDELEEHLAAVHIDVCCEHCGRAFDNT